MISFLTHFCVSFPDESLPHSSCKPPGNTIGEKSLLWIRSVKHTIQTITCRVVKSLWWNGLSHMALDSNWSNISVTEHNTGEFTKWLIEIFYIWFARWDRYRWICSFLYFTQIHVPKKCKMFVSGLKPIVRRALWIGSHLDMKNT